jgi:hypothetical protein
MKLLALVGRARSGKNTAADYLLGHGYDTLTAFASPLKDAAQILFNLTEDEVQGHGYDREMIHKDWGISVREILQKLGTESIRDVFGRDHWVDLMRCRLIAERADDFGGHGVIITDCRFYNEVELIRDQGGVILGLRRQGFEPDVRPHASEEMATNCLDDVSDVVVSAGNVNELHEQLDDLLERSVI